jgi:UDP-N-acetylglucosamine acyltransferase
VTTIGSDNLFMAYSHVAHDCHVGSRTVFVNGATLAGHVEVGDDAVIGAYSAVHQFCRVGRHAYVGGYTVVTMDALPFAKTVGQKATFYGLNSIGLRRKGLDRPAIARLEQAMKLLVYSGLNTRQAIERIAAEVGDAPEVADLLDFLRTARRGVIKTPPGRRGERGGGDAGDEEDEGQALAEAGSGVAGEIEPPQ